MAGKVDGSIEAGWHDEFARLRRERRISDAKAVVLSSGEGEDTIAFHLAQLSLDAGRLKESAAGFRCVSSVYPWAGPLAAWLEARLAWLGSDLLSLKEAATAARSSAQGESDPEARTAWSWVEVEIWDRRYRLADPEVISNDQGRASALDLFETIRSRTLVDDSVRLAISLELLRDRAHRSGGSADDFDERLDAFEYREGWAERGGIEALNNPGSEWRSARAQLLWREMRYEALVHEARDAIAFDGTNQLALYQDVYGRRVLGEDVEARCGRLLKGSGDLQAAVTHPDIVLELLTEQAVCVEGRDPKRALDLFRMAQKVRPGDEFAQRGVLGTLATLGRYEEAMDELVKTQRRLERNNLDLDARQHVQAGLLHRELGDLDAAIASMRMGIRKDPDYAFGVAELARALGDAGQYDDAVKTLDSALEKRAPAGYAGWFDVVVQRVDFHLAFDQPDAARALLDRVDRNALAQQASRVRDRVSASFVTVERYSRRFEEALKLGRSMTDYQSQVALGWVAYDARQYLDALTYFENAERQRPYHNEPQRGIARSLRSLGRPHEAAHYLQRFSAKQTDDGARRLVPDLAWALIDAGQGARAKQLLTAGAPSPGGWASFATDRALIAAMCASGDGVDDIRAVANALIARSRGVNQPELRNQELAQVIVEWAVCLIRKDMLSEALRTLAQLNELPLSDLAHFKLSVKVAHALLEGDHRRTARSWIESIAPTFQTDPDYIILMASLAIVEDRPKDALDLLRSSRATTSTATVLLRARAFAQLDSHEHRSKAIECLRPADRPPNVLRPREGAPRRRHDLLLLESYRAYQALQSLEVFSRSGRVNDRELREAQAECSRIYQQEPSRSLAARVDALINGVLGDPETAIETITGLERLVDPHGLAFDRALVKISDHRWGDALDDLKEAVRHDAANPAGRYLMGVCHLEIGKVDEALRDLAAARRYMPSDPRLLRTQASALLANDEPVRALQAIDACRSVPENLEGVHLRLTRVRILAEQTRRSGGRRRRRSLLASAATEIDRAESLAAKAGVKGQVQGLVHYHRGVVLALRGDSSLAEVQLHRALEAQTPVNAALTVLESIDQLDDRGTRRLEVGGNVLSCIGVMLLIGMLFLGTARVRTDPLPTSSQNGMDTPAEEAISTEPGAFQASAPGSSDVTGSASTESDVIDDSSPDRARDPYARFPSWSELIAMSVAGLVVVGIGVALPRLTSFKASQFELSLAEMDVVDQRAEDTIAFVAEPLVLPDAIPLLASIGIYHAPAISSGDWTQQ